MKNSILSTIFMIATFTSITAQEATWTMDKVHSKFTFTVVHLSMSEVDGIFKDYEATVTSSKEDFSDAVFNVSANLTTVTTNNDMRDGHLQKEDMFDTANHPKLTFTSTAIESTGDKTFKLTGNLTIKGVTKEVVLDLKLLGTGTNPMSKKEMAGFKITGTINRADFGVGNMPSAMVSEDIALVAAGEFVKE